VSVAQANEMSSLFGKILTKAGADPFTAEGLQGSMNQLVRVNASNARNSGFLTANDYSLVLQVALAVGRPLPAPRLPRLAPGDDSPPRGDWRTKETQPTLLGTYSRQSTMQIVSESGDTVFGSAATAADGSYAVRFTNALAPGSYVFRMRALALQGGISRLGKAFRLTILAPTPKGPRALG
jgi:hypothetical protein